MSSELDEVMRRALTPPKVTQPPAPAAPAHPWSSMSREEIMADRKRVGLGPWARVLHSYLLADREGAKAKGLL